MKFPHEIFDLIFLSLSRHDLWALSLVSRQFNEIASPTLYKTIIIALWSGVSLPPKFVRSLILGPPNHPKIHLIQNFVLLAQIEPPDDTHGTVWELGARMMVNELVYAFLQKLGDGQLRRFIWRSDLKPDGRILVHLANHHGGSLECLYLDRLEDLKGQDMPAFNKFCSLNALRLGRIRTGKDMPAVLRMLEASAASLRTFSVEYAFSRIHRDDIAALEPYHLQLSQVTEYQTTVRGLGGHIVNISIPFSQMQRFHLTNPQRSEDLAGIISRFDNLVELAFYYIGKISKPLELSIFNCGGNLKILSMCTTRNQVVDGLSTESLLELGRRCPNLVELLISQNFDFQQAGAWQSIRYTFPDGPKPIMEFPLHAFRNLELLFISISPFPPNDMIVDDETFNEDSQGQCTLLRESLEAMVDGKGRLQQSGNDRSSSTTPPGLSKKLNIVAVGIGAPEFNPYVDTYTDRIRTPRLWKAIHPCGDSERITFDLANFDDVMDNDPRWKLLRRYPLLIPNEGVRQIFRQPHLPPSELIPELAWG